MNRNALAMQGRLVSAMVAVIAITGAPASRAAMPGTPPDLVSVRSVSGQFVAYASRSVALPPALMSVATNANFVQLEPNLATVSCERIKQLLLRELDSSAPWQGTIYLVLYPARTAADTITITSQHSRSGWQYRVDLPDVLDRDRYVHAMVEVLLLEMANRAAQTRAAEAPLWLTEGFAQLLLDSNEPEIILPPPRSIANGLSFTATRLKVRKEPLLQQAQRKLQGKPPLTFEALSWPADEDLAGATGERYRGSAQLFVGELLRLPEGRAALRSMLADLPRHYNWQFAFLGAFHRRFQRPLDVEKWWALCGSEATERGLTQTWTIAESWEKLDQAVHPSVQVRTATNELPLRAEVSLQRMLREWDPTRQTQAINSSLRELGLLRLRIAQEYIGLVQDYCQVLENYLQQRDRSASASLSTKRSSRRELVEAAAQQLDALDARRESLRPSTRPLPASQSPAPLNPAAPLPASGKTISSTKVS